MTMPTLAFKKINKEDFDEPSLPRESFMKKFFTTVAIKKDGTEKKGYKLKALNENEKTFPSELIKKIRDEVIQRCNKNLDVLEKKQQELDDLQGDVYPDITAIRDFCLKLVQCNIITEETFNTLKKYDASALTNFCQNIITQKKRLLSKKDVLNPLKGAFSGYIKKTLAQLNIDIRNDILANFFKENDLTKFFSYLHRYCKETWDGLSPDDVLMQFDDTKESTLLAKYIMNDKLKI